MRHAFQALAFILTVLFVSPVFADDPAREIIERAIKARCEKPELLDKQRCEIITLQGKLFKQQQEATLELPATGDILVQWPTSFRWNRNWTMPNAKDDKLRRTWAVNVDKGWSSGTGMQPTEMNFIEVEECKMEIYGRWLATLLPLRDKSFTIAALKDSKIGDEEVSVVKVIMRFRPDAYMSFSKKSGQLLKIAHKAREGGVEMRKEHLFSDYKAFDGLMLPTKLIDRQQIGNSPVTTAAEWTITSYKFPDKKLPADTFAMPEKK